MLDSLLQDWFGSRSQETFVHRSEENRSGWDEQVSSAFSSYVLPVKSKGIDVLKEAYRLCKNRLNVLLPGKKIPLSFRGKDSYTNGSNIVISTEVVDEKSYSAHEKLDVLLGLLTHEAAHILHTNFDRKFIRDAFQKTILNILEDERIEFLIGSEFPGYGAFLGKLKAYYFDFKHTKKDFSGPGKEAFDCFFRLVRFPKHVDIELVEKHAPFLVQVKEVITPYPESFESTAAASNAIADLFERYFEELVKEEKSKNKSSDAQDEPAGEARQLSLKEEMEIQGAIQQILDELSDMMDDQGITSRDKNAVAESRVFNDDPMAEEIIKGNASFNPDSQVYFIKAANDRASYAKIRTTVMQQARSLARAISIDNTPLSYPISGLRNGNLDDSLLVEAILGRETVYSQQQDVPKPTISVVLMIDESGSMEQDEKIEKAKTVAILFNEALKLIPSATLSVYGYTSDLDGHETDTITIYKEKGFDHSYAIGSIQAKCCNRDGRCVNAVVDRISKHSPGPSLLFVISDGQPYGSKYDGDSAIEHTRAAIDNAQSKGFYPIQIGIEVEESTQRKMYDDFVNFHSAQDMVNQINKLLRNRIGRLLKTKH